MVRSKIVFTILAVLCNTAHDKDNMNKNYASVIALQWADIVLWNFVYFSTQLLLIAFGQKSRS